MVIVKMSGGLGNQMFQYALYRKMQQAGKDVKLDLSAFQDKNAFRKFSLNIFPIDYQTADLAECRKLGECSYRPVDKLRKKLLSGRSG